MVHLIRALICGVLFFQASAYSPLRNKPRDLLPRTIPQGIDLKILPLGASITLGVGSTTGNGYRQDLLDLITAGGNQGLMVGTVRHGTMNNNEVEAYAGYTISEVGAKAARSGAYKLLPNVVLIHVGTNDCAKPVDEAHAPDRMNALLLQVFAAIPDVTVLVSSLVPTLKPTQEACEVTLSAGIKDVATKLAHEGRKILFVDMHDAVPLSDINPKDRTHPNDAGYKLMAEKWYESLKEAGDMITPPASS